MDLRWLLSEALVAGTVPETPTKEKQEKLIINKSNCEQDNGERPPNRSKGTDNSKHVDNLEELDIIKEHVKNVQNSPNVESPETAGQLDSYAARK